MSMDSQPSKLREGRLAVLIQDEGRLLHLLGYSRLCFLYSDALDSSFSYMLYQKNFVHYNFSISSGFIWFGPGPISHAFGEGSGAYCSGTTLSTIINICQTVAYYFNWHQSSYL